MDRPAGLRVGPYQLGEKLRDGPTGVVLRAVDPDSGLAWALVPLPATRTDDRGTIERLRVLATRTAPLHHPYVAAVVTVVSDGARLFAVEPLVEGRTLAELAATGAPLSIERVVQIVHQLAEALDEIHERGVVHADLSPTSVVVDHQGNAVLVDVGLASLVAATRGRANGIVLGRPEYTAPEAVTGTGQRVSVDLYALGVIAYELLVGRPPFVGRSTTAIISAQVTTPPPSPRGFRPDVSEAVERVVLRQLAKAPARRYLSAGGFAADLAHAALDNPSEALTPRPAHRIARQRGPSPMNGADQAANGTDRGAPAPSPSDEIRARATTLLEAGDWRAAQAEVDRLRPLDAEGAERLGRLAAAVREAEAARADAREQAAEKERLDQERASRIEQLVLHAQAALDAGNLEYAEQVATQLTTELPDLGVATSILHEARRRREQRQVVRARASDRLAAGDWRGALTEIDRLHALGDSNVSELERMGEALWRAEMARSAAERRVAEIDAKLLATDRDDTDPAAPISRRSSDTPPTPLPRHNLTEHPWMETVSPPGQRPRTDGQPASYARRADGRRAWTRWLALVAVIVSLIALVVLLATRIVASRSPTVSVEATATTATPAATVSQPPVAQATATVSATPTRDAPAPTLTPAARLAAAEAALAASDFPAAIDILRAIESTDPTTPGLYDALYRAQLAYGRALLERGDLDGSEASLTRALEIRPDDPTVKEVLRQVTLARYWAHMEAAWTSDESAAMASLEEIIRIDPGYRDARQKLYAKLVARADDRLRRGDHDGALADLLRAIELVPDGPEARALLARLTPTPVPPTPTAPRPAPTTRPQPARPQPARPQPAQPRPVAPTRSAPAPARPGLQAPAPRPSVPIAPPENQLPDQTDRPFRPSDRPL